MPPLLFDTRTNQKRFRTSQEYQKGTYEGDVEDRRLRTSTGFTSLDQEQATLVSRIKITYYNYLHFDTTFITLLFHCPPPSNLW